MKTLNTCQVFGTEPPLTLFQMARATNEEELDLRNRESMATIISVYETSVMSTPSPVQNRRHSLASSTASFRTAAEEAPPPSATSSVSAAGGIAWGEVRLSPRRSRLTSLVRTKGDGGRYDEFGHPHNSPSSSPTYSSFSQGKKAPSIKQQLQESLAEDFHVRRRRAAKLSKFFGVGYQDLTTICSPSGTADPVVSPFPQLSTMTTATTALLAESRSSSPPSHPDRDPTPVTSLTAAFTSITPAAATEDENEYPDPDPFSRPQSPPTQVQIKTPNRFWGIIGIGGSQEDNCVTVDATYEDVIERLRGLRAS
jgi:hypothetical protein